MLATNDTVTASSIVLGIDTGGVASAVRRWDSTAWVIGQDHKVWRSVATGWLGLADPSTAQRIAVDASNNTVWSLKWFLDLP